VVAQPYEGATETVQAVRFSRAKRPTSDGMREILVTDSDRMLRVDVCVLCVFRVFVCVVCVPCFSFFGQ